MVRHCHLESIDSTSESVDLMWLQPVALEAFPGLMEYLVAQNCPLIFNYQVRWVTKRYDTEYPKVCRPDYCFI